MFLIDVPCSGFVSKSRNLNQQLTSQMYIFRGFTGLHGCYNLRDHLLLSSHYANYTISLFIFIERNRNEMLVSCPLPCPTGHFPRRTFATNVKYYIHELQVESLLWYITRQNRYSFILNCCRLLVQPSNCVVLCAF